MLWGDYKTALLRPDASLVNWLQQPAWLHLLLDHAEVPQRGAPGRTAALPAAAPAPWAGKPMEPKPLPPHVDGHRRPTAGAQAWRSPLAE
jgi:hypothetical protein